jgi:hypothetical protein
VSELKNIVHEIFNNKSDGISFLPMNSDGDLQINGFVYSRKYKEIKSQLGNYYHIAVYKADDYGEIYGADNFTAILTDPRVYVENLIKSDFYGVVAKQTTGSKKFISDIFKRMKPLS